MIERMVDLAADELGIDPAELRRRNYIPPEAMPFKTGLTFTYDSGEFEKNMDMALKLADAAGFEARRAEARKRGKLRGIGISNTIERAAAAASRAPRSASIAPARRPCSRARSRRGRGTRPCSSRSSATGSASHPDEVHYIQGDTDQVFFGEGTGGSRSATIGGSAFHVATEKIVGKATRDRRPHAQGRRGERQFRRRHLLGRRHQPHADHQGGRQGSGEPGQAAEGHGGRPDRDRRLQRRGRELPQRLPHLRARDRRRRPARSRSCATAWSTTSAPCSIRCC